MKCPACKCKLNWVQTNIVSDMMEKRNYSCVRCLRNYERLILKDSIGLIKNDSVYELDVDGNHIRVWK